LHSGFPVTINSTQFYNANQRTNRANRYAPLKIRNQSTNQWFGNDPSAASCLNNTATNPNAVSVGTGANPVWVSNNNGTCAYGEELSTGFGTSRVGSQRAPSFKNFDMAASKQFAITEGSNLEFRADFFNLLNTVSLGPPDQSVSDSNFGQITNTNSTERQIQLALKYTF